jgi:D-glycero-D-manno-heptose 1,7-bisphosphate phosphatase
MRAVFLDRDGVINQKAPEGKYIAKWDDLRFLPGAVDSVAALFFAGFKIFIVSNQRGIALGNVLQRDLEDIHNRMREKFESHGVTITKIYVCPHDLADNCACRKPKPGMLLRAAQDFLLDLPLCWVIGDAASDIAAGQSARCRTVWITPDSSNHQPSLRADIIAADLPSAVRQILQSHRRTTEAFFNV